MVHDLIDDHCLKMKYDYDAYLKKIFLKCFSYGGDLYKYNQMVIIQSIKKLTKIKQKTINELKITLNRG